jgi:hypothetical protein
MRGKRFANVRAEWRENLTEKQQNQAQERDGNGGRNAKMSRLAEPAIRFVMAAGVRVRHDLEQKEERNQGQRKSGKRGQPAIPPGVQWPGCVPSEQALPFVNPSRRSAHQRQTKLSPTQRFGASVDLWLGPGNIDARVGGKDGFLKNFIV